MVVDPSAKVLCEGGMAQEAMLVAALATTNCCRCARCCAPSVRRQWDMVAPAGPVVSCTTHAGPIGGWQVRRLDLTMRISQSTPECADCVAVPAPARVQELTTAVPT
jgi:hypothetical protein